MWRLVLKKYCSVLIATLAYANSSLYDLHHEAIKEQFLIASVNVIDNQLWECGSCIFMT